MKINIRKVLDSIVTYGMAIYIVGSLLWIANNLNSKSPCEEAKIEVEEAMGELKAIFKF